MSENEIKDQRDCFMALAFASADVLIEAEDEGQIRFALGAMTTFFGSESNQVNKHPLPHAFHDEDKHFILHLLKNLSPAQRVGPFLLAISDKYAAGSKATVSAFQMPGRDGIINLALSSAANGVSTPCFMRDIVNGLINQEHFITLAQSAADQLQGDETSQILFVRLPSAADDQILLKCRMIMRLAARAGLIAQVDASRYMLLQDNAAAVEELKAELTDFMKSVPLPAPEFASLALQGQLAKAENHRHIIYAVNQFAIEDNIKLDLSNLSNQLDAKLSGANEHLAWFKRAIISRQLTFVGQSIIDLADHRIKASELLVRFRDKRTPFAHLKFAESVGLSVDLDMTVIEYALAYLNCTDEKSCPALAVNLSAESVRQDDFLVRVMQIIHERLDNPDRLILEITEQAGETHIERLNAGLQSLRKLGIRIAIDNYGAGQTSLQYLRNLNVDILKIDGNLVKSSEKNGRDTALVKAMASLARDLNIKTVASHVETMDLARTMKEIGIDYAQGYAFGRPTSLELQKTSSAV